MTTLLIVLGFLLPCVGFVLAAVSGVILIEEHMRRDEP